MIHVSFLCQRDHSEDCLHAHIAGDKKRSSSSHSVRFIYPAEEWESPADTTERYTLRPTMAVDGKSAYCVLQPYSIHTGT